MWCDCADLTDCECLKAGYCIRIGGILPVESGTRERPGEHCKQQPWSTQPVLGVKKSSFISSSCAICKTVNERRSCAVQHSTKMNEMWRVVRKYTHENVPTTTSKPELEFEFELISFQTEPLSKEKKPTCTNNNHQQTKTRNISTPIFYKPPTSFKNKNEQEQNKTFTQSNKAEQGKH